MAGEQNFDSIKQNGYTNKLSYRGPKQRSGLSFDYMDKLNEFIEQGIFYDADGKGFTKEEKLALEQEFFKIHEEKGYDTNFKRMQAGRTFDYSYDDFVRLAQAAGYLLKEEPSQDLKEKIEEQGAEVAVTENDAVVTDPEKPEGTDPAGGVKTDPENPEVTDPTAGKEVADTPEGNERISNNGKDNANLAVSDLPDGHYDIDFEGTEVVDLTSGKVVSNDMTVTINDAKPAGTPDEVPEKAKPDTPVVPVPEVVVAKPNGDEEASAVTDPAGVVKTDPENPEVTDPAGVVKTDPENPEVTDPAGVVKTDPENPEVTDPAGVVKTDPENPEVADTPEGNERISNNGKDKANDAVSDLPDGEVDIDFEGTEIVNTQTGEIVKNDMTVTVNGITPKEDAEKPVATPTPAAESTSLLEDPDFLAMSPADRASFLQETRMQINSEISDAERTSYQVKKGGFLGIGKKTVTVQYSPEELAARQANLPQLRAELDELERVDAYTRQVMDNPYWSNRINPGTAIDSSGNIIYGGDGKPQSAPSGRQVETEDGRKLIRIDNYDPQTLTTNYTYYEPTVYRMGTVLQDREGNDYIAGSTYWGVAPDMSKEVTDSGLPIDNKRH